MKTAFYHSPLGYLQMEVDEGFLIKLIFVDEAGIDEEDDLITTCRHQLDEYFAGTRKVFDLPLRQEGTPFQSKVWDLLATIPFGKTTSYAALTAMYGDAKAIRAVASANGKNNLAIIIPCHRVIGSNNSLTGYAGGLSRKKWLLEHESRFEKGVSQPQLF